MSELKKFSWRYKYDVIGEPPSIYITGPGGYDLMDVWLEPEPTVYDPGGVGSHWKIPDFVTQLIKLMNENELEVE